MKLVLNFCLVVMLLASACGSTDIVPGFEDKVAAEEKEQEAGNEDGSDQGTTVKMPIMGAYKRYSVIVEEISGICLNKN